ncbi:MAG: thioredoxin domain-containing protein [Desulfovibrionaceae bacterium]|nr:thioredoxin domain-containing protein [Desulfovibrionaceae bacterium]
MLEITKDSFAAEVEQSPIPVVIDFWGPQCGPCLALMPEVEQLAQSYTGRIKFCKVNVAAGNRRLCIELKVMSVPAVLFYKDGECKARLVGDEVTIDNIKKKADSL